MRDKIIDKGYELYCKEYGGKPILTKYGFEFMSGFGECYDFMKIAELIIRKEKIEKIKNAYSIK